MLEVQTGYCNYFSVAQPLSVDIAEGDMMRIVIFHDRLVAEPAEGHIAILLANEVVWERFIEIPAEAASYDETFAVARTFVKGEPIGVHLHNHGYNTWSVLAVETVGRE